MNRVALRVSAAFLLGSALVSLPVLAEDSKPTKDTPAKAPDWSGYVYVTDLAGRNPYRSLPRYWAAENAAAAAMCQGQHPAGGAGPDADRAGRSRPATLLAGMVLAGQRGGEQDPVDAAGDVG